MAMHRSFADWYRSAALTPTVGLLEQRWAGVENLANSARWESILALARLFTLPQATEAQVEPWMRDAFHANDSTFATRDNVHELQVLAGAALRVLIEQRQTLSALAALALVCGAFGPHDAALLERDHLDAAQRYLVDYSRSTRTPSPMGRFEVPEISKTRLNELLPAGSFSQPPQLQQPLINALSEITAGFASALTAAQQSIEELTRAANIREEEVAILWWLESRFSRELNKSHSDIGYVAGSLLFPMEAADRTRAVPGSGEIVAVLVHALQTSGAPSSTEPVSVASAVNALPRAWRQKAAAENISGSTGQLTPLLLAIRKSLETEGLEDWFPVYRGVCDVSPESLFPAIQLSLQLFRERMLLKAIREVE